ncbi:hypothetical protein K493DRAFT_296239 [Basidiobolus meristosporus CBS 931.73]|uniref:V-type proton ATPase subunit S1/VOA1 transmembrane domain-containing protein n=1 Tax=Basidiobolus meristosporus CBS 931.73 TaxID=1314790 RepID=A0A1Y1Z852_9FUNG|nr:hypothetical protein K493DRAFT_296239 [Basidiobolus meristosporus CBS 931.73]|eukprot:ORY05995.1 hypothetical protein K493DRAFT_296239 [Basidiobolus meristosporus CBS 931.73]
MYSPRVFKILALLATSFVATAYAEAPVGCPAKVAVVLNNQQTAEYMDSPSFSLHKRMIGNGPVYTENVEYLKSSCDAEPLDLAQVEDLKPGAPYVVSGAKGSVELALEHIQSVTEDYVVVLDHKAHLQKRQLDVTPTQSGDTTPTSSVSIPGPTTNPGKNDTSAGKWTSKFWSIGLLTGLLTSFIMILILLVGVCWLASIEGPTRFEAAKQKRS